MKLIVLITLLLCFCGCGGSSDSAAPVVKHSNLTGTWINSVAPEKNLIMPLHTPTSTAATWPGRISYGISIDLTTTDNMSYTGTLTVPIYSTYLDNFESGRMLSYDIHPGYIKADISGKLDGSEAILSNIYSTATPVNHQVSIGGFTTPVPPELLYTYYRISPLTLRVAKAEYAHQAMFYSSIQNPTAELYVRMTFAIFDAPYGVFGIGVDSDQSLIYK